MTPLSEARDEIEQLRTQLAEARALAALDAARIADLEDDNRRMYTALARLNHLAQQKGITT